MAEDTSCYGFMPLIFFHHMKYHKDNMPVTNRSMAYNKLSKLSLIEVVHYACIVIQNIEFSFQQVYD